MWTPQSCRLARGRQQISWSAGGDDARSLLYKDDAPDRATGYVTVRWADCEMRATNGPGTECRTLQIRGSAAIKTAAISVPRRLPAIRTNTLALLAHSAATSNGRYLSL